MKNGVSVYIVKIGKTKEAFLYPTPELAEKPGIGPVR